MKNKVSKWGSQANNVYSAKNQQMNQERITPRSLHGANKLTNTCTLTNKVERVL